MKENLLKYWKSEGIITNDKVLEAFKRVDREEFVPEYSRNYAYQDTPLSIGSGQTISQPTTVALMTQALNPRKGDKILEVGAGSGYQAAVLSEVVGDEGRVYTIEYLKDLYLYAKSNLEDYDNVIVLLGDGSKGYSERAPYDKIIVTAASPSIPKPLKKQLTTNGVLVIPVGNFIQTMTRVVRTKKGYKKEELGEFRFVPLKGEFGF